MLAIDATGDTVTARMATSVRYDDVCLDHTGKYLFYTSRSDSSLRVYDTRTDSLVAVYPQLPFPPLRIMSNPDLGYIYLACQDLILVYPDAPPGVQETPNGELRATKSGPTVVRGVLMMEDRGPKTGDRAVLLDAAGRKVMDLKPGANDVRTLVPGVYFLRRPKTEDGRPDAAVRKIVIAR